MIMGGKSQWGCSVENLNRRPFQTQPPPAEDFFLHARFSVSSFQVRNNAGNLLMGIVYKSVEHEKWERKTESWKDSFNY